MADGPRSLNCNSTVALPPTQIPLDLLRRSAPTWKRRGTTPIPTNHQENQRVPIQPVFATGDMAFLESSEWKPPWPVIWPSRF